MSHALSEETRRRLDIQGFECVGDSVLAPVASWLRLACGLGAVWLLPTAWMFNTGHLMAGYVLGGSLAGVAVLVSTTDVCIPSLMFRTVFGFPPRRSDTGTP